MAFPPGHTAPSDILRMELSFKLFRIPEPSFFVFYNGEGECPQESEMCLSDAYIGQENLSGHLELRLKVININTNMHHPILAQCKALRQYSMFIEEVRRNKGSQEAIRRAVEKCIHEGILADYLARKGSEVVNMLMAEYDYQKDIEVHSREAAEKGHNEERSLLLELIRMLCRDGRIAEIEKATSDVGYLDQLLAEYGLS